MHLPNLALFHVAFLSHPKPKVYLTPKAQSGGWSPAPCAPQCPAMPRAIGWPCWILVPISIPVALPCGTEDGVEALGRAFVGTRLGSWLSPCQGGVAPCPQHMYLQCARAQPPQSHQPSGHATLEASRQIFLLSCSVCFLWVK